MPEQLTVIIKPDFDVFDVGLVPTQFLKPAAADPKKLKAGFDDYKYIPGVEKTVKFEFRVNK